MLHEAKIDKAACRVCGEIKPTGMFYAGQLRKTELIGECKDCTRARVRLRAANSPKVAEYEKARRSDPLRKSRHNDRTKQWRLDNPLARKAHIAVGVAVRARKLERQPCLFCGAEKVNAHHRDYTKPLEVIWLCARCHVRLHVNFPETAAHEPK